MFEEFPPDATGHRAALEQGLEQGCEPDLEQDGEQERFLLRSGKVGRLVAPDAPIPLRGGQAAGDAAVARPLRSAGLSALPAPGFTRPAVGVGAAGGQGALPVLAPLAGLLPGGVRRGDAVAVRSRDRSCDYLTLALLAGALGAGLWCAAVGVPELGGVALAELLAGGLDPHGRDGLDRLLLAPEPGERWAQVAVAMADGVDLVLVRPPGPVDAAVGRRVDARLRQGRGADTRHSAALVVLGSWPSARVVLHTEQTAWVGLDGTGSRMGTGHLTGGLSTIVAQGRATGGQARSVRVWLPAADGTVRTIGDGNVQSPVGGVGIGAGKQAGVGAGTDIGVASSGDGEGKRTDRGGIGVATGVAAVGVARVAAAATGTGVAAKAAAAGATGAEEASAEGEAGAAQPRHLTAVA